MTISHDEAREVARAAVGEVFDRFGVDLNNPTSVNEFRKDMMFSRRQRQSAEDFGRALKNAGVVVLISGIAYAVWYGIKYALTQ